MNADEFVKIVRIGSEKLRVDEIIIIANGKPIHGKGIIEITPERISLNVTIDKSDIEKGNSPPVLKTGVYTKKDTWTLSGIIEDQLHFKCERAGPSGDVSWSWPDQITRHKIKLHPIELTPYGWSAMSRKERNSALRQHQEEEANKESQTPQINFENELEDDFSFQAMLREYDLISSDWENDVKGETDTFDFVMNKSKETSDINIFLKSKKWQSSRGEKGDWKMFYAFMNALAFIHGVNAWPYRIVYSRAGQVLIDRVTASARLSGTIHVPFTDKLAFNAKTGSLKWSLQDTIKIISKFFETESLLSEEISYLLFVFRQAGAKGVHRDITVLTLCILFENLVRLIFQELKLEHEARKENSALSSFEEAKTKISDQIRQQFGADDEGYKRLHSIIKGAETFNVKQMFQTIVIHFGFRWEGDMESVFKTWKRARNPLVHQPEFTSRTDEDLRDAALAESRIAGAINVLLLKLFGYSGHVSHSIFEDGYRQI